MESEKYWRKVFYLLHRVIIQKILKSFIFGYTDSVCLVDGIKMMPELEGTFSNRWLSTMTIDPNLIQATPYEIIDALNDANIEARPVWKPLHMQPLFTDCPFYAHEENNIVSEELFATGICLPSDTKMTVEEQQHVINIILENM